MHKLVATVLIIALTVPSSFAFADANTAADLYRDASEAYQRGSFSEAASLLEKAYVEDQNLIYKYNQILAYMGARNHAEALRVLDQHNDAMKADGRFDDLDEIRQQLETAIAKKEKAEQDKIAASSPANTDYEKPNDSVVAPPAADSSSPNYLAWSLVGVGGAAMASSVLFFTHFFAPNEKERQAKVDEYLKTMSERDAWNEVYNRDQALADSDASTLNRQSTLGYVMLGTGIALAGTGLALWYFDIPGGSTEKSVANQKRDDSSALQVRFSPFFSTESAGASMHLKF